MNITFSEDVTTLGDVVSSIVARWSADGGLRRTWEPDGAATLQPLWRDLAETGLPMLAAPGTAGGFDLPLVELIPVLHRLAHAAVPDVIALTVCAVVPLLAREPDGSPHKALLEQIAQGAALATVQDGWAGYAPWAGDVDVVLVLADDAVTACRPTPVDTVRSVDGSRRLGRVDSSSAIAALQQPEAATVLRRALLAVAAASLFGLADRLISMSVDYACLRTQFGRPIGTFQAVQHRLASAYSRYEFTHRSAWYAAWTINNDPEHADVALWRAKALAGDVAVQASSAALQIHGGLGYTWESDLHLYMKRVQVLDAAHGSAAALWDRLAGLVSAP